MPEQCVYLALPQRPGADLAGEIVLTRPVARGRLKLARAAASLLNLNFNRLWANALNCRAGEKLTHFAMQHDDVRPAPGWADVLIDELDRHGADVISAVVPLKDDRGLTSTGLRNRATGRTRRLTLAEVHRLPPTFGLADLAAAGIADPDPGEPVLVVNTGLWVCRLDRPWVGTFPGFQTTDLVRCRDDGRYEALCLPEDWMFSEWAAVSGVKVLATRAVPLAHLGAGGREYRNDSAWGAWVEDVGDAPIC